jgi:hypothetical protein
MVRVLLILSSLAYITSYGMRYCTMCRGDKLIYPPSVTVNAIPALILTQDLQTKQDFNNAVEMVS